MNWTFSQTITKKARPAALNRRFNMTFTRGTYTQSTAYPQLFSDFYPVFCVIHSLFHRIGDKVSSKFFLDKKYIRTFPSFHPVFVLKKAKNPADLLIHWIICS
ncbi:hypothetical protein [Lactobacillus delbrueckii]|uniref:hypothetical protein n=1 Tax=Lactobacillus delbrueckii TaxID=1584 RepID=UPI00272C67A7|nr:hypothetical protein [Lactobacillus delbrueckii]WKZ98480.1 hypothetical protein MJT43_00600 [Lactobacillus delbrueckii]